MNAKAIILFFIVALFVSVSTLSGEVECIANPTPTHVETNYVKLEIVKEIPLNIDNKNFMAFPWLISTDGQGNFFVYDLLVKRIFKFDKDYRLVKAFGKAGKKPGEFGEQIGISGMSFSKRDGMLYLADMENRRFIKFDSDGNHLNDFSIYPQTRSASGFFPVLDNDQNFFVLTGRKCTVDVFNLNREDGKMLYSLLDKTECGRSLILKVRPEDEPAWNGLFTDNAYYDVLPGNRLVVYTANASTMTIFEKDKAVKTFNIWPKKALDIYRQEIEKLKSGARKGQILIAFMFTHFFVDKDNEDSFYLECPGEEGDGDMKRFLYQFDFEGGLKTVFYSPQKMRFVARGNGIFYATGKNRIYILKEKEL